MWRVVGVLIGLFLLFTVLGVVLRALRWLIGVGILVAIIAALVGAAARSRDR